MIKIVRVIGRLNIGGPAIHTILLTERMNDDQFQSVLVTGDIGGFEGDMHYAAQRKGILPFRIPELGREISWRDDVVAFWKLYRLLARESPDIVHTHTAKAGTLGRLAAVVAGVPIRIHTFHGHIFHGYFDPIKTRVFKSIERILALFTTRIIAISEEQKADLSDKHSIAPTAKFTVMPIGLDLEDFLRISSEDASRQDGRDEVVIGFVGRLVPIKNPAMAVDVFAAVRDACRRAGARVRFVIVGDGELRADLERQVDRLGLQDDVRFEGWQRDVSKFYRRFDLLLLTSINEGTPVALIESMAAGVPFVATRVGGIPDLMVGPGRELPMADRRSSAIEYGNGVLVEPGDISGCAITVAALIQDRVRLKAMGAEGRRFVESRYSINRLVSDLGSLYKACVLERRSMKGIGRKLAWSGQASSDRKA